MNLFLNEKLTDHRRGRFLMTQLDAVAMVDELPVAGVLLMIGSDFQGMNKADQKVLWQWCRQPGRTLLLLPPYQEGAIFNDLDWKITFRDQLPDPNGTPVADKLTDETTYQIEGRDGEFDKSSGHQWGDFSVNTRYLKQNSGSGVFAATTLPLWSIALLDAAEPTLQWITKLSQLAGKPAGPMAASNGDDARVDLTGQELAAMVMVYGWSTSDADELRHALAAQAVPIMSINEQIMTTLLQRLSSSGYLAAQGLSEKGLQALKSSAYWGYALSLREEVA